MKQIAVVNETRRIDEIKVGYRYREDLTDIQDLANSINALGQLQPILITEDNTLIAGCRRLEACKFLGFEEVKVVVADNLDTAEKRLMAERDENRCRVPLNPVEAVAIGKAIEEVFRPEAEKRKNEGRKKGGPQGGRGKKKTSRANCPIGSDLPKQDESARTAAVAADYAGMSRRTYDKAKAVVDSENEAAIDQMKKTGNVNGAYTKMQNDKYIAVIEKKAGKTIARSLAARGCGVSKADLKYIANSHVDDIRVAAAHGNGGWASLIARAKGNTDSGGDSSKSVRRAWAKSITDYTFNSQQTEKGFSATAIVLNGLGVLQTMIDAIDSQWGSIAKAFDSDEWNHEQTEHVKQTAMLAVEFLKSVVDLDEEKLK